MSIFRRIKAGDSFTEPSGLTVVPGASIAIHAMMSSYYSAGASVYTSGNSGFLGYGLYGLGDIHSVNARVHNEANISAYIAASGSVGDVNVRTASNASAAVYISAGSGSAGSGDIGDINLQTVGHSASAYLELSASGDIGVINITAMNVAGDASASAYAYGGDIAGLNLSVRGGQASASVGVSAFGGDIGYIRISIIGGNGEATVSAYASAHASDDGLTAVGGNIGDIAVMVRGGSTDLSAIASAFGLIGEDGQYLGGGNIGDISFVFSNGSEAEPDIYADAYSGGSIGNINIRQLLTDTWSASAAVYASAWGAAGEVVSIGDIRWEILSRRGDGVSASANFMAGQDAAGNIGSISITLNEFGGGSSNIELSAFAYAGEDGSGGNIGDIRLVNTGYAGDTSAHIEAGTSVGNAYMAVGPGGSEGDLYFSGYSNVGDITFVYSPENISGSYLDVYLEDDNSIGLITVMGGSKESEFYFGDSYGSGGSIAGIDLSRFAGYAELDLTEIAETGTTIKASRGGSYIEGTEFTDNIYLGSGADEIRINSSVVDLEPDFIYDLEVTSEFSDKFSFDFSLYQLQSDTASGPAISNPVAASTVAVGDVLRLIDVVGQNSSHDILTESGLLAALNGGEYANFNAEQANGTGGAIAVVAANEADTRWRVFKLEISGTSDDFVSAELLAIVESNVTLAGVAPVFGLSGVIPA